MQDDPIQIQSTRLVETDTEAGRALRAARTDPSLDGDQPAAWQVLHRRLARSGWSQAPAYVMVGAAAGLLVAAGALGLWRHHAPGPVSPAPVASTDLFPVGERPVDLPRGPSALELSPEGNAQIRRERQQVTVSLGQGAIDVAVTARPVGREFRVEANGYRFSVVGTRFRVDWSDAWVKLEVREGRVTVSSESTPLATVSAGESWQGSAKPAVNQQPPTAPTTGPSRLDPVSTAASAEAPEAAADCLRLARENQAARAARCYERVAGGQGLSAEMAQVELARLRRDVLHDSPGAQRALREYLARYPNGAFRTEAAVSLVEILVQSGQTQQALGESERLLVSGGARERDKELRLLRGRILQEELGDCGRAEREYAQVAADPGPIGDQAQLRQAECLERLGRSDEAITAYRAYLGRANAAHAAVARARLEALSGHAR
jgi:hypothetical protein